MDWIAEVAVEKTAFHFDRLYSYRIPQTFAASIQRGIRVLVPFGRGNRKLQGLVYAVSSREEPESKLKSILAVLDEKPILNEEGFQIVEFMAETTFCSRYDALKCILPPGLDGVKAEEFRLIREPSTSEREELTQAENQVLEFLEKAESQLEINRYFSEENTSERRKAAHQLVDKGIFSCTDLLRTRMGNKTLRMVRLSTGVDLEQVSLTPKQKEVVQILQQVGSASEKEAAYHAGVREGVLKTLAAKGVVEYFDREIYRTPRSYQESEFTLEELTLSPEQEEAFGEIRSLCVKDEANAALLFGVTGSGKTQVFIKLIEACLQDGKQAMLLVPEISLTPQLLAKFRSLFGSKIAVIHSSLSMGERLDEYRRIQNGDAQISIGTRSSIFAPFSNIGLIILDEEGEHSYKSDNTPRYHAREIAKLRCVFHHATLLMASATPSIESFYAAKTGRYALFTLKERYGDASLPEVRVIDMRNELQVGNTSPLSDELAEALLQNWQRKEQSILLINRRGFASYALCADCGEPLRCPNCSITLTYHKANGYFMCHYCGYTAPLHTKCPSCGSSHLNLFGTGTQKIEEILAHAIPDARILRMDTDTVSSRYSYEENFSRFEAGEYDILIGTQMVAKGLNFPNVTLVGVLNSDQSLYSNDFRCGEKTFSLITQVVGRSGRSSKRGIAYIQTMSPENDVIQNAAKQDYLAFYSQEIALRKASLQPPFCDLAVIGISGSTEEQARRCAEAVHQLLRQRILGEKQLPIILLGVSQAGIYRINGKFRYRIILKCKNNKKFRAMLRQVFQEASAQKIFNHVTVFVDINGEII
ncbi:MAG: primosomal protein N' [Candidatus Merdivicinus sp.]